MRILANENVPGEAVEALRSRGHDVMWVRTSAPGIEDRRVVHLAETEERVIVTLNPMNSMNAMTHLSSDAIDAFTEQTQ